MTRTRDLLITSADFAVFHRFTVYQNMLQRSHFSDFDVSDRLATKHTVLQLG